MRDWPVVVTNRCAEACARQFGLAHRDGARAWLYKIIRQRGQVTDKLPQQVARVQSGSGYFMVANDVVVLPLNKASDGTARWIATDCTIFPAYRKRYGNAAGPDPVGLTGARLLRHVHLSTRAVERYQEYCDGDPNLDIARVELRELLVRDAHAVIEPPGWAQVPKADFYLVSADEFVLPMSRGSASGYAFDAFELVHRARELFLLRGSALAMRCQYATTVDPAANDLLVDEINPETRLSWRRPRWAAFHPSARFWLHVSPRLVAPVGWQPDQVDRPLLIYDVVERPTTMRLLRRWLTPT